MTNSITNYILGLHYSDDKDISKDSTQRQLLVAGNGIFQKYQGQYSDQVEKVSDYTPSDKLPELEESLTIHEDFPKIPFKLIKQAFAFYKWAWEEHGTEAQCNFYWNKDHVKLPKNASIIECENDIVMYAPKQENSKTLTSVKDDETFTWLRKNLKPYVETHSHNTMDAFMSGTDRSNSYHDGFQLVFGKITSDNYALHAWVTSMNHIYEDLSAKDILKVVDWPYFKVREKTEVELFIDGKSQGISDNVDNEELHLDLRQIKDATFPEAWKKQQVEEPKAKFSGFGNVKWNVGNNVQTQFHLSEPNYWLDQENAMGWTEEETSKGFWDNEGFLPIALYPHFNPEEISVLDPKELPPMSSLTQEELEYIQDIAQDEIDGAYGPNTDYKWNNYLNSFLH